MEESAILRKWLISCSDLLPPLDIYFALRLGESINVDDPADLLALK
jgi:hypothetical protein